MDRNHDPDSRKLEPETLYELGCAYLDCIYVAPYPDWAASFFEEAASYGHHPSEFMLGEIYRTGVSHQYARSFEKAAEYYRLSAEGGYPPAQFSLALSHHRLGDAGYPEYRHWLGVACKNGEPHALVAEALDILSNSDEESRQNAFDLLHRAADSGQWYAFIRLAN
jgi:TPR repeat protein